MHGRARRIDIRSGMVATRKVPMSDRPTRYRAPGLQEAREAGININRIDNSVPE
jgi:hypothetical protein